MVCGGFLVIEVSTLPWRWISPFPRWGNSAMSWYSRERRVRLARPNRSRPSSSTATHCRLRPSRYRIRRPTRPRRRLRGFRLRSMFSRSVRLGLPYRHSLGCRSSPIFSRSCSRIGGLGFSADDLVHLGFISKRFKC